MLEKSRVPHYISIRFWSEFSWCYLIGNFLAIFMRGRLSISLWLLLVRCRPIVIFFGNFLGILVLSPTQLAFAINVEKIWFLELKLNEVL